MRPSYREHVVWRTLTRTRYLLVAALVVAVALVAVDRRPRAENCTWYYSAHGREIGACIPRGQAPPPGWRQFGSFRTPRPAAPFGSSR